MKKFVTISIIFVLLISLITTVKAADSFSLNLTSSVTTVNPGDTVTLNIVLGNLNVTSGDKGIGAVKAKITYDEKIFELKSITAANNWELSKQNNEIVANTADGEVVKQTATIGTVVLKVLDTATIGNTTLKLEGIEGSSVAATINGTSAELKLQIAKKQEQTNPPAGGTTSTQTNNQGTNATGSSTNSNQTSNNQTGNKSTSSTTNKKQTTSTTAKKALPKTGIGIGVLPVVSVLIITAIVFFNKYKTYKDVK